MKDRVDEFASILRRQAAKALAGHPDLRHTWMDQGSVVTLSFPPADESGFEVALQVGNGYAYVLMGQSHHDFDLEDESPDSVIARALGLIRDLLSPMMRLRELRSGGQPYRWFVEADVNGRWVPETEHGLLFYNYFGKRTEHFFQNRQLPPR
jgi:hypothetical protein